MDRMATHVTIHEAEKTLIDLIERVQDGEEIVIDQAGRPIARIVPAADEASAATEARKPGSARGEFVVPRDFNEIGRASCRERV